MSQEEKKYPKIIAGAFIFDKDGKLLMVKMPAWDNKFNCVGGKVEMGEKIEETVIREVKEETNLDVDSLEFIGITEGLNLGKNTSGYKHLIFVDYKVNISNPDEIELNEEGEDYEWHTPEEWLKKDKKEFSPYNYEIIEKIQNKETEGESENKYKRALADYQNLLKQTAKEKEEFGQFARMNFLHEILPVYDNLKISLQHFNGDTDQNNWAEGIRHIVKQFKDILENMGVMEIKTVGEKFDHHTMEAVDSEETKDKKHDGIVARELSAGYKLNGKVVKVARVVVYKIK
jgi:molecular chaperone GrpE (heat shock protein)